MAPRVTQAQYYYDQLVAPGQNPGGVNGDLEYDYNQGRQTGWSVLLLGVNAYRNTPTWSPTASVPFPFQVGGQPVHHFKVSTTGVLTFDTTAVAVPALTSAALPAAALPSPSLCIWGLTMGPNSDRILTKTFGTAPNRQFWVQFNSVSQPGRPATATFWSIVLEETSNAVYFIDQHTTGGPLALSIGIQAAPGQGWQVTGSPTLNSRTITSNQPDASDNVWYAFYPGAQPAQDLALPALTMSAIQGRGQAVALTGKVANVGNQPISSYTLNWRADNGPVYSEPVTGLNLGVNQLAPFTSVSTWVPPTGGAHAIKAWVSNPNGTPDGNVFNDTTRLLVEVADSVVPRVVMEEVFTSSTCPPCRPGNANLLTINNQNPGKWVAIKYQQNFPAPGNDPYYTLESGARFNYYGLSAIPYMMLDGGWNGNANSLTSTILNQFYDKPAYAMASVDYAIAGTTVDVNATFTPFLNYDAGQLSAYLVITEKRTTRNARTNGERVFYDVMKKMLPNQYGTSLPALTRSQPYTLHEQYTFPATNDVEHFDSLRVVLFVQNLITKEVLQASLGNRVAAPIGLGVAETGADAAALRVTPNPVTGGSASAQVRITLPVSGAVALDVFDALGRRVASRPVEQLTAGAQVLPLALPGVAPGLYVVRLTQAGGVTRSARLVVE